MLKHHFHKPVVLLLDEYDVPIQQAWEQGYYTEAIAFMRNFLSLALKTNQDLDFALLTGVLRIAKESIFSGLNNLIISSVIEESYPTAMGFTTEDVHRLANARGHADKFPEIQQWYDGYRFAGVEIYNPWSVLNYYGFLLGMTALLMPQYEVQSNRESGYGRFDLAIFPKEKNSFGAILEFKTAATEADLEKRATEALQQIECKGYIQAFLSRDITKEHILKYGIAFFGKHVMIRA